jgi:NAD-dependent dihydropyrimidine dehydrogenase PreA subunit
LGKKIMGKQLRMPVKVDRILIYLKYAILVLTVVSAWVTASIWMSPYDPWAAFGHLGEGLSAVWNEFALGLIILIVTVAGSFFYDRFFCKYLCPMGGFLGLISKISPFKIHRDAEVCINCNLCSKACAMNIDVAIADDVNSAECINCQECTNACPKKGALTNQFSFKKIIVSDKPGFKPLIIGLLVLVIYFGGIGLSRAAGLFQVLPKPITVETVITNPDELKGYMTITDVSSIMGIPLDEVYRKMGIPENVKADTPMKDIPEVVPGFDFHTARENL